MKVFKQEGDLINLIFFTVCWGKSSVKKKKKRIDVIDWDDSLTGKGMAGRICWIKKGI